MTNTEETTRQHLSLLLVVLGQRFILFFRVVILLFLPRRDEDSLSITLPSSSLIVLPLEKCFSFLRWQSFLFVSFSSSHHPELGLL